MSKATLTIEGFLAKDANMGRTSNGDAYLNLSIAHTPQKKNRDTGQYEDAGPTLWVQVTLWKERAEAFVEYARKSVLVVAEGEPSLRSWESNGKSGVNLELRFARVSVVPRSGGVSRPQPADEPWATPTGVQAGAQQEWGGEDFGDDTPF